MEEQLVSFQVAKLAKEKGFNKVTRYGQEASLYNKDGKHTYYANYGFYGSGLSDGYIPAPTQSLLKKWIREVHKIYVTALPSYTDNSDNKKHYFELFYGKTLRLFGKKYSYFPTYEEALEIGLFEALNLIKNE